MRRAVTAATCPDGSDAPHPCLGVDSGSGKRQIWNERGKAELSRRFTAL